MNGYTQGSLHNLSSTEALAHTLPRMSKQPIDNASIKIKRKRAHVWPHETTNLCEQVIKLLAEEELVRELSPPEESRTHPSTEAFIMKGGYRSRTTSAHGILPRSASTHKTLLNRREDPALEEASSPTPIPLSPNYFDVLSEEQDAPPEEIAPHETEREFLGLQRVIALRKDPKGKAPMLLREQETMAAEETLLSALHRSREEAQRSCLRAKGLQIG